MIKILQKLFFISVNDRGQMFFIELLFTCLLLVIFIFSYTHIKIDDKTNETIMYFKVQDIVTIAEAKQIVDSAEINKIIDFYMPNAKKGGKRCIVKDTNVWESKNSNPQKHEIRIKVCY